MLICSELNRCSWFSTTAIVRYFQLPRFVDKVFPNLVEWIILKASWVFWACIHVFAIRLLLSCRLALIFVVQYEQESLKKSSRERSDDSIAFIHYNDLRCIDLAWWKLRKFLSALLIDLRLFMIDWLIRVVRILVQYPYLRWTSTSFSTPGACHLRAF